jgi:hypothetical protein
MSSTPVGADASRQAREIEQQRRALEASRKSAPEPAGPAGVGGAAPASKAGPSAPAPAADAYTHSAGQALPQPLSRQSELKLVSAEEHAQKLSTGKPGAGAKLLDRIRAIKDGAQQASAARAAALSGLTAARAVEPPVQELTSAALKDIQDLARSKPEEFSAILEQAFGPLEPKTHKELLTLAQDGKLPLPQNVRFLERSELQGANAAYSPEGGGTVFLSRDLASDPEKLKAAFTEELGHHLDDLYADGDSPGDEGQIFQQGVAGAKPLGEQELAAARAKRDQGTIMVDGKPVAVEFQHPQSAPNVDAAADRLTDLLDFGLMDWAVRDSKMKNAVQSLENLAANPAELGQVLEKLADNGALATLVSKAPEEMRKRLFDAVERSGDDKAKAALAKGVGAEVSRLMSGMITTDGDTKKALEQLRGLRPPMLGQALDAVRKDEKLPTLLAEMPAKVRSDFMKTVQQSGDSKAQAIVAKAVSEELDKLQKDDIAWLKHFSGFPGVGPLIGLGMAEREGVRLAEQRVRQKELQQMLGTNTPEVVRSLVAAGSLWDVQKNLIQPPTEQNREALSALVHKLKDDPGAVAYFQAGISTAVAELANDRSIMAAAVSSIKLEGSVVKWDAQSLIAALEQAGKKDLAEFLKRFDQQMDYWVEESWNWSKQEGKVYQDVLMRIEKKQERLGETK